MGRKAKSQAQRSVFAWHGVRLELPPRWNPVKLEGDYNRGHALFADLHRPRLGVRWQRPRKKRFDPQQWTVQMMRDEVGMLAAEEAGPFEMPDGHWQGSQLYIEPDPPGRDVWLAYSGVSGRAVQVVHHAHRREQVLAGQILPALADLPQDQPQPWSVFELSCVVPGGLKLAQHQLNAGDLTLRFTGKRQELIVRQVAVASLALKRVPLKQWLAQQLKIQRKHYRVIGEPEEVELAAGGPRTAAAGLAPGGDSEPRPMKGLKQMMRRRRRFFWARWIAPEIATYALHDQERDRLILVQATSEQMVREVAATVGWAATYDQ